MAKAETEKVSLSLAQWFPVYTILPLGECAAPDELFVRVNRRVLRRWLKIHLDFLRVQRELKVLYERGPECVAPKKARRK